MWAPLRTKCALCITKWILIMPRSLYSDYVTLFLVVIHVASIFSEKVSYYPHHSQTVSLGPYFVYPTG